MRSQPLDFVQVTYNILDREVEARILPLARERGIAVIVNRPFREGALIKRLERASAARLGRRRSAATNWAQVLLKFIVSHPAVTCAIPATTRVDHVQENMAARQRPAAGPAMRARMIAACREALMSEWWTYSLSDFLLFSPRTYYRLFELYNSRSGRRSSWRSRSGSRSSRSSSAGRAWHGRAIAAILAACWLWVAWAYLFARYATINWAARYFAAGFALRRCCWPGAASCATGWRCGRAERSRGRAGLGLFALRADRPAADRAAAVGRPWTQVEISASRPIRPWSRRSASSSPPSVPLWHLASSARLVRDRGATLWTMGLARRPGAACRRRAGDRRHDVEDVFAHYCGASADG